MDGSLKNIEKVITRFFGGKLYPCFRITQVILLNTTRRYTGKRKNIILGSIAVMLKSLLAMKHRLGEFHGGENTQISSAVVFSLLCFQCWMFRHCCSGKQAMMIKNGRTKILWFLWLSISFSWLKLPYYGVYHTLFMPRHNKTSPLGSMITW